MGENIRNRRISSNCTQETLALEVGVKQNTVSTWETGETKPSYENLLKLADFFKCTVDELLGR